MANADTFRNTLAGLQVRTTHLYAKYLTFDRVIDIVTEAIRQGVVPNSDGNIEWRYKSKVKGTNPYRTAIFAPHWLPGSWLEFVDYPSGGHSGLIEVKFENPYKIKGVTLRTATDERGNKMLYQSEPPEGFE